MGAVSGAITAGIGNVFSTAASGYTEATKFASSIMGGIVKAGAHAIAQGTLSMSQGGNFYQAFATGALGSLAAGGWGKLANFSAKTAHFAQSTIGMVSFGAISGGTASYLTGGNFWHGFIIGGTVAGLNDALHKGSKKYELGLLNDKEGAGGFGHGAVVGNDKEGYFYSSNERTDSNGGFSGPSKIVDNEYFSTKTEMLNADSKRVYHGTNRYDRSLVFKITAQQVNDIRINISTFLNNNYNLITNNCAHI